MVTFSTRDSEAELTRKLGLKKKNKDITIINEEEFTDHKEDIYICNICNGVLQYDKMENAGWCNQCIKWIQLKDVKKTVSFEVPQPRNTETLVSCPDFTNTRDVSVHKEPEPKGTFARLKEKGLRITNYREDN
jgi:hypothetical protein